MGTAVSLDGSASSDADGDGLSYHWVLTERPPGSNAVLNSSVAVRPSFVADVAGNYVATLTVSDGATESVPARVTVTALPADTPTIVVDQNEPLSGSVRLSLSRSVTGVVSWYVDLVLLTNGSGSDSVAWNTTTAANGSHLLVARVPDGAGGFYDVRRSVTVSNSPVALSAQVLGTTGTIRVTVSASSPFGITAVSATFDGAPVGTITSAPYVFTVDALAVGSGDHTMVVTATDGKGNSKQVTIPVPVANVPGLSLTSPLHGALVNGVLRIAGTVSSDRPGGVTVVAWLDELEILRTTSSSFSSTFDVSGLAARAYRLRVVATDSAGTAYQNIRTVVVTSSPGLAYAPLFDLGAGYLLDIDDTRVLYQADDSSQRLRDLNTGAEVSLSALSGAAGLTRGKWHISGGLRVFFGNNATTPLPDCSVFGNCAYLLRTDGSFKNISTTNPYAAGTDAGSLALGDPYVLFDWHLTLYEASSDGYLHVEPPAGGRFVEGGDDLFVDGGIASVVYSASFAVDRAQDVYRWTSDSKTSTKLSNGGSLNSWPQTDGQRVAWLQQPLGSQLPYLGRCGVVAGSPLCSLLAQPVAGGSTVVWSSTTVEFRLRDGVLVWIEGPWPSDLVLKAATSTGATTLSFLGYPELYGITRGIVVFLDGGKVYSWNSATGVSTLRIDVMPSKVLVGGGAIVFYVGSTVYRAALD